MSSRAARRGRAASGAALLVALAAGAAPASAQQPPAAPTAEAASEALATAEATLSGSGGQAPPDATLALNALAAAVPQLEGAERRHARALLTRPTDGANDRYGDGFPAGAPVASAESAHFCVFWVTDPAFEDAPALVDTNGATDGDGVPDYVEAIIEIAEFSYSIEVAPGALGWLPPKPDLEGCGADPGAHADVYLKQLGTAGLFGYESPDPGQGPNRSQYGYMVIDDDYAQAEYGFTDPLDPAKVTFAHEFNHLLQQNYDSFQDVWMFEATATWAEEYVYPEINDYVGYIQSFASSPGTPITERGAARGLKIYGSNVWNHWLSGSGGGYGVGVVRRAWEVSELANPADFAVASYDRAIRDRGGSGFSRELSRFALATAEWRCGYGGFPDAALYPEMKRKGSLRKGQAKTFQLDHTAFRFFDVTAGRGEITLKVRAEDGVRTGFGLIARTGPALTGEVTRKSRFLGDGGRGAVTLGSPDRFDRITAVIVNADGRVRGFARNDWVYSRDNRDFTARLTR